MVLRYKVTAIKNKNKSFLDYLTFFNVRFSCWLFTFVGKQSDMDHSKIILYMLSEIKRRKLSHAAICRQLSLPRDTVSRMLRPGSNVKMRLVFKVAEFLDLSITINKKQDNETNQI